MRCGAEWCGAVRCALLQALTRGGGSVILCFAYGFGSFLYNSFVIMALTAFQYLMVLGTVVNLVTVYAFSNMHDVSLTTKDGARIYRVADLDARSEALRGITGVPAKTFTRIGKAEHVDGDGRAIASVMRTTDMTALTVAVVTKARDASVAKAGMPVKDIKYTEVCGACGGAAWSRGLGRVSSAGVVCRCVPAGPARSTTSVPSATGSSSGGSRPTPCSRSS